MAEQSTINNFATSTTGDGTGWQPSNNISSRLRSSSTTPPKRFGIVDIFFIYLNQYINSPTPFKSFLFQIYSLQYFNAIMMNSNVLGDRIKMMESTVATLVEENRALQTTVSTLIEETQGVKAVNATLVEKIDQLINEKKETVTPMDAEDSATPATKAPSPTVTPDGLRVVTPEEMEESTDGEISEEEEEQHEEEPKSSGEENIRLPRSREREVSRSRDYSRSRSPRRTFPDKKRHHRSSSVAPSSIRRSRFINSPSGRDSSSRHVHFKERNKATSSRNKCLFCSSSSHATPRCTKYKRRQDRIECLQFKIGRPCWCCLRPFKECQDDPCNVRCALCKGDHNFAICTKGAY